MGTGQKPKMGRVVLVTHTHMPQHMTMFHYNTFSQINSKTIQPEEFKQRKMVIIVRQMVHTTTYISLWIFLTEKTSIFTEIKTSKIHFI